MVLEIRNDRHWRSLTGLSQAQFDQLLLTFTVMCQEAQQEAYAPSCHNGRPSRFR